jgi:hypothetical protein
MAIGGGGESTDEAELEIRSTTGQADLWVVDSDFRRVAQGRGSLTVRLSAGIYEVVAHAGSVTDRRLVRLVAGERTSIVDLTVTFPSAAPIAGTSTTQAYHEAAADLATQLGGPLDARDGGLVLMFRDVRGSDGPALTREDLALSDLLDQALSNLADPVAGWRIDEREAWAWWGRHVPAGGYVLRSRHDGNDLQDQSLWVVAGWQTIVFVARTADGPMAEGPSVYTIPMSMTWQTFARRGGLAHELALWDLRSGNAAQVGPDVGALVAAVQDDLMLGIVLAHTWLRRPTPDMALVRSLVETLGRLAPDHPDVLALRLLADPASRSSGAGVTVAGSASGAVMTPVAWPPMLLASYLAVLKRDADAPGTIVPGSLAEAAAEQVVVGDISTTWRPVGPAAVAGRTADAGAERAGQGRPLSAREVLDRIGQEEGLLRSVRPRTPAARRVAGYLAAVEDLAAVDKAASVGRLEVADVARATHLPHAVAERTLIELGPVPAGPAGSGPGPDGTDVIKKRWPPILPFFLAVVLMLALVGGVIGFGIIGVQTATQTPSPTATPTASPSPTPEPNPTPLPTPSPTALGSISIPPALDFGQVEVPAGAVQGLVIRNTGNLPIAVTAIDLGGQLPDEFAVDPGTCLALPIDPGDACRASVTFRPATTGPRDAQLTVTTDRLAPAIVDLTGTGIETGDLRFDPTAMSFDPLSSEPVQQTAVLVATGPLTVTGLAIDGPYASEFQVVKQDCVGVHLMARQTCRITVQYTAPSGNWANQASLDRTAELRIPSASGKEWTVPLVAHLLVIG